MAGAPTSNPGGQVSAPQNPGLTEHLQHKNRLQEYAQRCAIQLPVYETINEGSPHAPQFRSTVTVDGQSFKSAHIFAHRKEAEQDVAKFALESISRTIKQEGCSLIHGDTTFCKSILNEYAAKMKIEKPTYTTSQSRGILPIFISSVVFDEKTCTGGPGKNKKEAEQIAARSAIESILGHSSTRTLMTEIIKSKSRLYAAIEKGSDPVSALAGNVVMRENMENCSVKSVGNGKQPVTACTDVGHLSDATAPHEPKKPKQEYTCGLPSCSSGSGLSLPYQPQGGLPAGPVSKCFEPATDESKLVSQLKNEVPLVDPVVLPSRSEGMASSSKNKRQCTNRVESPVKRTRTDEGSPS